MSSTPCSFTLTLQTGEAYLSNKKRARNADSSSALRAFFFNRIQLHQGSLTEYQHGPAHDGQQYHGRLQKQGPGPARELRTYVGSGHETGYDFHEQLQVQEARRHVAEATHDGNGHDDQHGRPDGFDHGEAEERHERQLDERRSADAERTGQDAVDQAAGTGHEPEFPSRLEPHGIDVGKQAVLRMEHLQVYERRRNIQ